MLRSLTTLALFLAIANHSAGSSLFDTWCFDQFGVPSGYTLRDGGHPERASLVQGFELADDTLLSLPKNLNLSAGVNETVTVPTQCFVDGAVPFGAGVGELNFTICSADRTEEDMLLICLAACAKVDGCDAVHYHGFDSGSALCRLHELAPDYPYCTEFPLRMECDTVRRADGELSGFICPDAPADPSKYDSPLGSTVQLTKAPSVGKKWKIGGYMYIDLSVTCTADDPNEDLQVAFAEALELHVPNAINASVECGEDSGNSTEIVYWLYSWTDTIVDTIDNDISTWLDSVITDVASSLNLSSVPVVTETSASTWTFEGFRESEVLEYPTCLGTDGTVAGLPINPWNAALVFKDLQFYPESHAPLVNFYRSMSRKNTDFFPIPEGCFSDTTGGTESNPALAQGGAHYILLGEDCVGNRTQEDMIRICMSICAQIDYGGPGTRDDRCWGVNFDEFEWGGHCHLLSSASNPMQYNAVCAGVTAFDRSTENRAGVCTARAALVSSDAPRAPFHSPAYPRSNLGQAFPRSNLGRLTPPPHTYLRPVSRRALIHHWPVASSLPCPAQTARESCSTHLHTADCGMKNFISIFCHVPDFSHAAGPLTSVKCALGTTWEGEECVTVGAGNYTRPGPYPGRSDALPRPNDFPGLINVEAPCPVGHYCPGGTGCGFGADLSVCPDTCSTIVQHEMFPDRPGENGSTACKTLCDTHGIDMHLSVPAGVPILKNGFWREAGGSTWIEGGQGCISTLTSKWVECLSDGVCLGGAGFGDQLCEPYHGGAFCEVCAQDTYKKTNGRCRPCDSVDAWSIATSSMVCVLFCGACIVLFYTVRRLRSNAGATATSVLVADAPISSIASIRQSITRDAEAQLRAQIGAKHAGARRKASHIFNFGSTFQHLLQVIRHKSSPLRSIFNFMQVVTKISITFHIRWPPMMLNVVSCLEVLTLNLFDGLIPFGCFAQFNFHTTMLTLFVGVTLVNAVFLFLYEVWFRHRAQAGNHLVAMWIFFNYFAYINMVGTTFAAFPCVETPSGQKLLRRDLSIDCASDAYRQHTILAAVGMIFYVFGIPILFIVMLRQAIKETGERRYNEARLAILHGPYKFNWYWAEALICIEKVTLIGVLVFIRESNLQVAIGAAVAVLWLFFFSAIKPFKEKADNLIKDITELCQVMVLLCTLLIKAHHSDSMYQVHQVDVALVIFFCLPIVAMVVDVALVLRELRRKGIYGVTDDKASTDTNDTNDDTNSDNNDDDGDDHTVASCRAHINAIAGAFDQDDDEDDDDDGACDDAALNRNGRTHGAMTLRAAARSAEIDDYEVEMCDIVSQLPSREGNGGIYRQASL